MKSDRLVVLFDGQCPFCIGWVKFLLDRDGHDRLRFASLQSAWARKFLRERGMEDTEVESVVVWDGSRLYRETEAMVRLAEALPGIWQAGKHLQVFPEGIRNKAYRFIAARRHRWFGKKHECWIPKEAERRKFLDSGRPGGHDPGHGSQAGDTEDRHPGQGNL